MPATEQTWYNQKLLHTVFGFSGLALLVSTLWMFAADHDREWKGYQRRFREAEQRLTTWRKAEAASLTQQNELADLQRQLVTAQTAPPQKHLYGNFKNEVLQDSYAREEIDEAKFNEEVQIVSNWFNASSAADQFDGRFAAVDGDYAELEELSSVLTTAQEGLADPNARVDVARQALAAALEQIKAVAPGDREAKKTAQTAFDAAEEEVRNAESAVADIKASLEDQSREIASQRNAFVDELKSITAKAKFREGQLLSKKKFRSADRDAANALLDIGVRDDVSQEELDRLQAGVTEIVDGPGGVNEIALAGQDATAHREKLQSLIRDMTTSDAKISKQIEANLADVTRLDGTFKERRSTWFVGEPIPVIPGKRWLELPILSAFGSPLKIDNLWTDGLMHSNGSFGKVRRFDRCTTCHQGIAKTAPGSATEPAFRPEQQFEVAIQTPNAEPVAQVDAEGNEVEPSLASVYGLKLASYGLVDDNAVTVNQIVPNSAAANAASTTDAHGNPVDSGLQVGDVILYIDGDKTLNPADVEQELLARDNWGEPATLTVLRGLPQPFTSHPRLDLFVGSLSPHGLAKFGCTSCHEGQGSATDFKWASHAPNTIKQEGEWAKDHDWFHNHHWIYPMYPKRFAESVCLKCHHEVAELEASPRFPDGPAPKVVEGWHLIGQYGCYGCHEINGYDGPDKRIGPDIRLEPNYFAAASAVTSDPAFDKLDNATQSLATTLAKQPYRDDTRNALRQFLLDDAAAESPLLSKSTHKMEAILQNQDAPGTRRKVGPSLRHLASKVGEAFAYDWIREPKNYRPASKMPQFFGLWDHLDDLAREDGRPSDLQLAKNYERVEILGMVKYLMANSQPMDYLEPAKDCEPADAARGKVAFEIRGCIACHQHGDFPHVTSKQGPNLTHLGDKFAAGAPAGKAWTYTWIKRPTHYHSRTKMPDLYLDPVETADGKRVDPVADMVEYLLSSSRGWKPAAETTDNLTPNVENLDGLVAEHLTATFPKRRAESYMQDGIPAEIADTLKGAEIELVGDMSTDKKLLYVGRKAIGKYGCYGCHDIPGFESAKPIGAALAEWGRKESSKLAFEHVLEYLHKGHGGHGAHGEHGGGHDEGDHAHDGHGHEDHGDSAHAEDPDDVAYFEEQIGLHERQGFVWQKLREPRSYDYKKVANKKYNDRLRMPLFPLTPDEREAIATFVLGLVADPPAEEFIYHPDPQQLAVVEGKRVLNKYNCGGCHILEAEKWEIESLPGEISYQVADSAVAPSFAEAHFSADVLAASATPDARRGVIKTILSGVPAIDNNGNLLVLDEDGAPTDLEDEDDPSVLQYQFQLWEPVAFEGKVGNIGGKLTVPVSRITKKWPAQGGDLTRWLLPQVTKLEKQTNAQANGNEAWGWLPPPLLGEGKKVQPDWLHAFLLEPHPIRPATFLRMPKFNMSPDEATKLVKYFAGRDGEKFPFEFDDRMIASNVAGKESEFAEAHGGGDKSRLDHAMQIVTNGNYCIKCHLVGDYVPESNQRALAPNLSEVQSRLRPTYLRNWITYPKHILPYTPMPINIPYVPDTETLGGVAQDLYPGTSIEQIDGLVDLLMNFSTHVEGKYDFSELVDEAAAAAKPAGAEAGGGDAAAAATDADEEPTAEVRRESADDQASAKPEGPEENKASES